MSIEELIAENTAAQKALTAAILAMGGKPAAAATGAAPAARGRPKSLTLEEVRAVAMKVQEAKGKPVAVALIKEYGAPNLAELDKAKYAQFVAAAEVLLSDEGGDEEAAPGEDEL